MKKLGLIQSRGLGDIIIALPIAHYYSERGWTVYWPIDQRFLPSFQAAVDYVEFIPFDFKPSVDGFLMTPMRLLKAQACDKIIPLYSYLSGTTVPNLAFARSLKFDEYKYAVAGVPFAEKWNIQIERAPSREQALFDRVVKQEHYVVRQLIGSDCAAMAPVPGEFSSHQVIDIAELTDNIFDWLLVLEKASLLILVDSCYANLVEQLGIATRKQFLFRSEVSFTPVLRGAWEFCGASIK